MKNLTQDHLKLLAVITMVIDHSAFCFFHYETLIYFLSRLIGKMTIPIMCYFISEGYYHTKSLKKYAVRLFTAAIVSHIPFYYFVTGTIPQTPLEFLNSFTVTSVMWTLFIGLMALTVVKSSIKLYFKMVAATLLMLLSTVGDWGNFAVIWILIFGLARENKFKKFFYFSLSVLLYMAQIVGTSTSLYSYYMVGLLLSIPVLLLYDGQRSKSVTIKWFFYVFYPLHLVALALIRQ